MAPTIVPPWIEDDNYNWWEEPTQKAVKRYVDLQYISREAIEKSTIILIQDIDGQITLEKNRYGSRGQVNDTSEVINIACEIIVQHIFKGRMKLFRETMRQRLVKSLSQRLRREIKK